MTLSEIVSKIMGLDPRKEYAFTVSEETAAPPIQQPTEPIIQEVPIQQPPTTPSSPVEQHNNNQLEAMQAEIDMLKKVNQALLARTPIEDSEKTLENRIYELVNPTIKKGE